MSNIIDIKEEYVYFYPFIPLSAKMGSGLFLITQLYGKYLIWKVDQNQINSFTNYV